MRQGVAGAAPQRDAHNSATTPPPHHRPQLEVVGDHSSGFQSGEMLECRVLLTEEPQATRPIVCCEGSEPLDALLGEDALGSKRAQRLDLDLHDAQSGSHVGSIQVLLLWRYRAIGGGGAAATLSSASAKAVRPSVVAAMTNPHPLSLPSSPRQQEQRQHQLEPPYQQHPSPPQSPLSQRLQLRERGPDALRWEFARILGEGVALRRWVAPNSYHDVFIWLPNPNAQQQAQQQALCVMRVGSWVDQRPQSDGSPVDGWDLGEVMGVLEGKQGLWQHLVSGTHLAGGPPLDAANSMGAARVDPNLCFTLVRRQRRHQSRGDELNLQVRAVPGIQVHVYTSIERVGIPQYGLFYFLNDETKILIF